MGPAADAQTEDAADKATIKARQLIVKSSGADYAGLAENEFICMSVARQAGLSVPRFWLSENRKLFVVERFDYRPNPDAPEDGGYLGFEDMTALMGRQTDEKYQGSYEQIAKAVTLFCSPAHVNASLAELFRSVALSVLLRNGDAHLKNFGLLYTHPGSDDCRLAPLYDVVNTTAYLPQDTLALKLGGSKAWPSRESLRRFGQDHCRVDRPDEIIDQLASAALEYRPPEDSAIWRHMRPEIEKAVAFSR